VKIGNILIVFSRFYKLKRKKFQNKLHFSKGFEINEYFSK